MEPIAIFMLVLRVAQLLLAVIVIGLGSATISTNNVNGSYYHSSDSYSIFCSAWSILVTPYLIYSPYSSIPLANAFAFVGAEATSNVFWLACWVSLICSWANTSCGSGETSCKTGKANIAFSIVSWVLYVFSTAFMANTSFKFFAHGGLDMKLTGCVGGYLPDPLKVKDLEKQESSEQSETRTATDLEAGQGGIPLDNLPSEEETK